MVSLFEKAKPMRIRAALSRDGVEVYGDHVNMQPLETQTILLQVSLIFKLHTEFLPKISAPLNQVSFFVPIFELGNKFLKVYGSICEKK